MKWRKIMVMTAPEAEEIITGVLLEAGAPGVSVQGYTAPADAAMPDDYLDKDDLFHEPFGVGAFFAANGDDEKALAAINVKLRDIRDMDLGVPLGSLEVTTELVDEADWENAWKAYFKPVQVSDFFVVKPTWEPYAAADNEHVIEIDPGMAFGTGTHESTKMCIRLLEEYVAEGMQVVDVGCGSGILSIAALLAGAAHVYALDHDSVAVDVTRQNLERNGVAERATVAQSDLFAALDGGVRADVIVANIIADIIIRLAPDTPGHIKKNGMFICSGVIDARLADVENALKANGFRIIEVMEDGEWRAVACKYKGL